MLRTIVIDDEAKSLETITAVLEYYSEDIDVIGTSTNPVAGISIMQDLQPDLVFLDIEMPEMDGFELLNNLPVYNFDVVFLTAHKHYAYQSIKYTPTDYLLKPLDVAKLNETLERVKKRRRKLGNYQQQRRITVATSESFEIIMESDILACSAKANYTSIHLINGENLLVSKPLKEIESMLSPNRFFRVHYSHVVQLCSIRRVLRKDGGIVEMVDGRHFPIAKRRKDALFQRLKLS